MFKAFGKIKTKKKENSTNSINNLLTRKNETDKKPDNDNEMANKIHIEQCKRLEEEVCELKRLKSSLGSSAAIFKLKEKIVGPQKTGLVPTIVKDPKTKKEEDEPFLSRTRFEKPGRVFMPQRRTNTNIF